MNCVDAITVEAALLPSGELQLTYLLIGDLMAIRIPDALSGERAEGLWQHSCFEAFIRCAGSAAYHEFNFSPSGRWQAYAFEDYRQGGLLVPATDPRIGCQSRRSGLRLQATLQPKDLPAGEILRLGLSASVEAADGTIGYWALQHAPGQPDFHHPDTFNLEIDRHEIRT